MLLLSIPDKINTKGKIVWRVLLVGHFTNWGMYAWFILEFGYFIIRYLFKIIVYLFKFSSPFLLRLLSLYFVYIVLHSLSSLRFVCFYRSFLFIFLILTLYVPWISYRFLFWKIYLPKCSITDYNSSCFFTFLLWVFSSVLILF